VLIKNGHYNQARIGRLQAQAQRLQDTVAFSAARAESGGTLLGAKRIFRQRESLTIQPPRRRPCKKMASASKSPGGLEEASFPLNWTSFKRKDRLPAV